MKRADIHDAIDDERDRQHTLWAEDHNWGNGDCSSTHVAITTKVTVLAEEFGEVARAVLEDDHTGLRTELIQLAAVAVAILEGMGE